MPLIVDIYIYTHIFTLYKGQLIKCNMQDKRVGPQERHHCANSIALLHFFAGLISWRRG